MIRQAIRGVIFGAIVVPIARETEAPRDYRPTDPWNTDCCAITANGSPCRRKAQGTIRGGGDGVDGRPLCLQHGINWLDGRAMILRPEGDGQ